MSRKPDPRPARTRALLSEALWELIQEKRWDRIRVQDVLERTGIGRSTFYAHFDNKYDLLTAEIPSLVVSISQAEGSPDLLPLFEHVEEMRPAMLPILSQPLLSEITDTFHRRMVASWTDYLTNVGVPEERRLVAAELLAGGFMAVAKRWLIDGCQPASTEICAQFTAYCERILEEAAR